MPCKIPYNMGSERQMTNCLRWMDGAQLLERVKYKYLHVPLCKVRKQRQRLETSLNTHGRKGMKIESQTQLSTRHLSRHDV